MPGGANCAEVVRLSIRDDTNQLIVVGVKLVWRRRDIRPHGVYGESLKQGTARADQVCGLPADGPHRIRIHKGGTKPNNAPISVWLKTMTCVSSLYVNEDANIDRR